MPLFHADQQELGHSPRALSEHLGTQSSIILWMLSASSPAPDADQSGDLQQLILFHMLRYSGPAATEWSWVA